ncbi:hypothetical protein BV22DRAFT_241770 [Leucogyrophana mollusca]|uniref:Uncharacterized protein n=1 Tax=Leucogyrophana mollusca TaxID=85980 RepID=A0ACB8BSA2_9AGAM|nr:hypothetical protein BV22DRAFT_241770 [Leucogyrophana mollusca]
MILKHNPRLLDNYCRFRHHNLLGKVTARAKIRRQLGVSGMDQQDLWRLLQELLLLLSRRSRGCDIRLLPHVVMAASYLSQIIHSPQ